MPAMPTQTKYEETMDVNKVVMRTITKQSFQEFEPSEGVRSYRKEQFDGVWTVVEEYLFNNGNAQWTIDGTVSTEPLESNKIFKATIPDKLKRMWAAWKRNPQSPMIAKEQAAKQGVTVSGSWWDPLNDGCTASADFYTFYIRWVIGYDSYLAPKIVIRMTEVENGPPSQENVGKIDAGWRGSNAHVPAGVDFILTAARGQQEGEKWRNTYEWMGSSSQSLNVDGNSGWDPLVYQTATPSQ